VQNDQARDPHLIMLRIAYSDSRNFGLDGVRALAIALVLAGHTTFLTGFTFAPVGLGFLGVELFFVLSGFLIGRILIDKADAGRLDFEGIKSFWRRRWYRTLPNYYLFFLINTFVYPWLFGFGYFDFSYLLFCQNLWYPCGYIMQESWSLSIEEWSYILLPLSFALFMKLRHSPQRAILAGLIVYIGGFTLIRVLGCANTSTGHWEEGVRKVLAFRMDAIPYGVLMAFLAKYHAEWLRRRALAMFVSGLVLASTAVALNNWLDLPLLRNVFYFTLIDLALAMTLPFAATLKSRSRSIKYLVTHLSIVSYSAYLSHNFFIFFLQKHPGIQASYPTLTVIGTYVAIIVASTLIYKYFEWPFMKLRDREPKPRPRD
jgi:peptidoglycan/LPS O-acetylase OafA/YrhL